MGSPLGAPTFFPPRGVIGVEVVRRRHSGPLMAPYVAHGFVLTLLEEGRGEVRLAGRVQSIAPGSVTLAEPGELVTAVRRHTPSTQALSLVIESSGFMRALDVPLPEPQPANLRSGLVGDRAVKSALRRVLRSVVEKEEELEQQVRYTALLAAMLGYEARERPALARAVVRRAKSLLHERWSEKILLDQLCREVGADPFYLIRAFARELGVTPHAYQVLLKVARARALLRAGRSLRDTVVDSGFADQSHLSRHFRRVVGTTPGRYARSVRDREIGPER